MRRTRIQMRIQSSLGASSGNLAIWKSSLSVHLAHVFAKMNTLVSDAATRTHAIDATFPIIIMAKSSLIRENRATILSYEERKK